MNLLAIIVNYRTSEMTLEALSALMRELEGLANSDVVIVDNGSGDDSVERIRAAIEAQRWTDRVSVIVSHRNGGFAYGNNLAIRAALGQSDEPRYVYLLNSDAFPDPGSVRELLDFLERHPRVGVAGSYIHGPDGETHVTAFRFPTLASELEQTLHLRIVSRLLRRWIVAPPVPAEATRVNWLAGASMLIRREAFEAIGLLDETFFLYFEETDFCRRALKAGWPTWYVPSSRVTHIGSASTGIQDVGRRMPPYWFASRKHYFRKHHGTAYLWLANLLWILGFSAWRVRRFLMRKPDPDPPRMLWDFLRHTLARTNRVLALSDAGSEAENGSSADGLRHLGADDHGIPPLEEQADRERETE